MRYVPLFLGWVLEFNCQISYYICFQLDLNLKSTHISRHGPSVDFERHYVLHCKESFEVAVIQLVFDVSSKWTKLVVIIKSLSLLSLFTDFASLTPHIIYGAMSLFMEQSVLGTFLYLVPSNVIYRSYSLLLILGHPNVTEPKLSFLIKKPIGTTSQPKKKNSFLQCLTSSNYCSLLSPKSKAASSFSQN